MTRHRRKYGSQLRLPPEAENDLASSHHSVTVVHTRFVKHVEYLSIVLRSKVTYEVEAEIILSIILTIIGTKRSTPLPRGNGKLFGQAPSILQAFQGAAA
ncbi:hypothetical protein QCA50_016604 [Cerrena zonata]|uniref:Uncharacterized protein n=1 Tax=Cerrena zonata TaxID=2478898 RepID=A0AAW0FQ71_9APHY